jgi:hypothetical protein
MRHYKRRRENNGQERTDKGNSSRRILNIV